MSILRKWKKSSGNLKLEIFAIFLACRDARTPWYAKALAAVVVGYAFSPIDLIPDPIPILGHLDDLVLLPLGVFAVRRMIPAQVLAEARQSAGPAMRGNRPVNRIAAAVIVLLWIFTASVLAWLTYGFLRRSA